MLRNAISAFTRVFDAPPAAWCAAAGVHGRQGKWVPALRRTAKRRCTASGTREMAQFALVGGGVAAAGWAAACGARPTITVRRPCPHSRLAAFLASSRVTASTMALRFSM